MAKTQQRSIRLARSADADFIGALSRVRIEHGLSWRWRPAKVRRMLADSRTTVIVSEDDGELSGFAIMNFGETSAHLSLLAVRKRFGSIGVASSLLQWLFDSCRIAGIGRINLEVRTGNERAIAFYRRHGFEQVGIQRGYYDGREDALLMSFRLIPLELEENRPR